MHTVLIVDDNLITRNSIKLTMNWAELDCRVVGDTGSGITALPLVKQYVPDLIITDIRMPGMDGLMLTKEAKKLYPWIKVIITTGYSEFSYAKEALRLGAQDLIVKPIDNDELAKVITKAISDLDTQRKMDSERESLKNAVEKTKDMVISKCIIDCIEGSGTTAIKDFPLKKYCLLTLHCANSGENLTEMLVSNINTLAAKIIKQEDFHAAFFWLNNCFSFVIEESENCSKRLLKDSIRIAADRFYSSYPDYVSGISRIHAGAKELRTAYRESLEAIDFGFYDSAKKILFRDELDKMGIIDENLLLKKFYDIVNNLTVESFEKAMNETRATLVEEKPSVKSVSDLMTNICFIMLDFYYKNNGFEVSNCKSHSDITAEISKAANLDVMTDYVKDFAKTLISSKKDDPTENYSKATKQVISYLNEHYNKKVSLQEISDYVSLTPSHLSRVIKKDTNKSFVDLFNRIKIDAAEKLLRETNLKVYEVANKVGIDNYSYFYQLFKKATGVTPTDYYNKYSGQ